MNIDEVLEALRAFDDAARRSVFDVLRREYRLSIHRLEAEWNTTAEAILEAIHCAPDLTQRGVRGILAEAAFRTSVVPSQLSGWISIPFPGDEPYDVLLDDGNGHVKVQVKNQRKEKGAPKIDVRLSRQVGSTVYVVETQRTRNGRMLGNDGESVATRPYRFGEFDILAVCLQPATGNWNDFVYCPDHALLARDGEPHLLKVMQPVFPSGQSGWTTDFNEAAHAMRTRITAKP